MSYSYSWMIFHMAAVRFVFQGISWFTNVFEDVGKTRCLTRWLIMVFFWTYCWFFFSYLNFYLVDDCAAAAAERLESEETYIFLHPFFCNKLFSLAWQRFYNFDWILKQLGWTFYSVANEISRSNLTKCLLSQSLDTFVSPPLSCFPETWLISLRCSIEQWKFLSLWTNQQELYRRLNKESLTKLLQI